MRFTCRFSIFDRRCSLMVLIPKTALKLSRNALRKLSYREIVDPNLYLR